MKKMKKAQYMEKAYRGDDGSSHFRCDGLGLLCRASEYGRRTGSGIEPAQRLFIFDEENSALVGEHTGKTYQLGETVTVRVTGANRYAGTVDFELEEAEKRGNDGKISTETGREQ